MKLNGMKGSSMSLFLFQRMINWHGDTEVLHQGYAIKIKLNALLHRIPIFCFIKQSFTTFM